MTADSLAAQVWMTSHEAAAYARLSHGAMKRHLASGAIRSSQAVPGGHHRIRREWIDEWLETRGNRRSA